MDEPEEKGRIGDGVPANPRAASQTADKPRLPKGKFSRFDWCWTVGEALLNIIFAPH
jgi:hypothetical protein